MAVLVVGLPLHSFAADRLWDKEPALWDVAQTYKLTRQLPDKFGVEGPVWNKRPVSQGINLCNGKLKAALWGPCDKLTVSVSKNDIWQRVEPNFNLKPPSTKQERTAAFWGAPPYNKPQPRPAGRLILECGDFNGASQPEVSTAVRNGLNTFRMAKGNAAGELKFLVTRSDSNIIALSGAFSGITNAVRARLWRGIPKDAVCQAGSDGKFFWIRCTLPAEKTFPSGFEFDFVGRVVGATALITTNNVDRGIAATAQFAAGDAGRFQVYATVVTLAETADPLAEAKKRLAEAESRGFDALAADNETWFKELFARREMGRIFTGDFGSPLKDIILPFFYMGSWQDRHCLYGNPDPAKYEGDAWYNVIEAENAPWSGLQCFNEEFFTGDFVAGRDESCVYYTKLVNFWWPAWQKHARDGGYEGMYYMRGYVPPIKNDVYFSWDKAAMTGVDWNSIGFSYKMVWNAFDYGGRDDAFLRDAVYPGLRDLADFFCSLVKMGTNGCYHIENSCLRENLTGVDALDCVATAKWVWKTAIRAADILKTDTDKRQRWQSHLDKIQPYYQMPDGTYGSALVHKGPPSPAKADAKPPASPNPDGQDVVQQMKSFNHFPIDVTDEWNLDLPYAERERAFKSCDKFPGDIEHLLGINPDQWEGPGYYLPHPWLHYFTLKQDGSFTNRMTLDTPFKKTMACWFEPERLCNSRSGTIYLFPCVPSKFDVAFKDMQARGGFLVSSELKDGKVTCVLIKARRTDECRVMNPWPGRGVNVEANGAAVNATRNADDSYSFATAPGATYRLTPQGLAPVSP
jgi:hypothetical protein